MSARGPGRGARTVATIAGAVIVVAGCDGGGERTGEAAMTPSVAVVTSVLPHADIVRRIGGDVVHVEVLIPPGAGHTTHEPTVRELRRVADADLFVRVGHPSFTFERAWFDRLIAESPRCEVLSAAEGAPHLDGDPHVWFSLPAVRALARRLRDELAERVPAATETFDGNLERFLAETDRLDAALRELAADHAGQAFYVFHPAFGYLADAYGFEQIAVEEHGKEPGAGHVGHVVDRARASEARVVFVQPQYASRSAEVVAEEIGARILPVDPLPADWVGGMDAVLAALREAFAP